MFISRGMELKLLVMAALLGIAGVAQAGSDYFAPNLDCTGTACTPYTNENPALTVSYVNPYYSKTVILTLNGVTYRGTATYISTLVSNPDPRHFTYLWTYTGNVLSAPDGSRLVLDMTVYYTRTLNISGHNFWVSRWTVLSGTVVTP